MNKGISPLIATVILIAFVVTLAGILSTFFTGFAKEQKAGVEAKSKVVMDCVLANFEIDKNVINVGSTVSVIVENKGQSALSGLKVVVYNSSGAFTLDASPDTMDIGDVKVLQASYSGEPILSKLKVATTGCPGLEDSVDFTFSYQEDANVYFDTNPFGNPVNELWMDGNWSTAEYPDLIGTKIPDSKGAYWDIKDEEFHLNVSIPEDCWDYDSNWLFFKLVGGEDEPIEYYCLNSTDYKLLRETSGWQYDHLYEEAIWWNMVE